MLIRSRRVRGSLAQCPEVVSPLYGPYPLPFDLSCSADPLQAKLRPESAVVSRRNDKARNVTHSAYHKSCTTPQWFPQSSSIRYNNSWRRTPGRSQHRKRRTTTGGRKRNDIQAYPLCLVCDRERGHFESDGGSWIDDVDSQEYLSKKFDKSANRLKAMERKARASVNKQRDKVLKELWEMEARRDAVAAPSTTTVTTDGREGNNQSLMLPPVEKDPSWAEMLSGKRRSRRKFVGEKEARNNRTEKQIQADVHRHRAEEKREEFRSRKDANKSVLSAKVRTSTDVTKDFAVQSPIRGTKGEDIIKEFVDQSFDKNNLVKEQEQKLLIRPSTPVTMQRDLEECLDMIEQSVSGKIIGDDKGSQKRDDVHHDDENNNDSTTASGTLTDTKQSGRNGSKKSSTALGSVKNEDVFVELLIDELKRENREVKFALAARDERLTEAAAKVREMVEQNILLSSRLERALRSQDQLKKEMTEKERRHDEKINALKKRVVDLKEKSFNNDASKVPLEDIEATIKDLQRKLEESEAANRNLQTYVTHLKTSYHNVFGGDKRRSAKETGSSFSSLSEITPVFAEAE